MGCAVSPIVYGKISYQRYVSGISKAIDMTWNNRIPGFVNIMKDSDILYVFEKYPVTVHFWKQKDKSSDVEQYNYVF